VANGRGLKLFPVKPTQTSSEIMSSQKAQGSLVTRHGNLLHIRWQITLLADGKNENIGGIRIINYGDIG